MIQTLTKVLLFIFIISFSACEDKGSQKTQTQEVQYKATLPMPEWDDIADKNIDKYWRSRNAAKSDPIPATQIGYAYANKLQDYEKALQWFEYSNSMKPTADNSAYACYVLQEMKQYDKAIKWCNDSIIQESNKEALFMLGTVYYDVEQYNKAIEYYKLSANKGFTDALTNIGYIYEEKLKDYKEAEQWYLKAVKEKSYKGFHGLSYLYYSKLNNNVKSSAYAIALIGTKYSQRSVLKILQKERKIPNETIKKGYELQLTSDEFPIKFKGDLGL
ncbi:tetratricopeptide repeat protein [Arcobacter defluvii]|uniref:beta-lactamase n=3 Tax=Arcobacter defluvii TaxID=873191 RepID=A0AAE7E7F5_9BACT|nr:CDC27 family protein [Arcobacter defluvii]QKF78021.1 tetratricopeptide repeat protein [Arcobacter defluvii]